MIRKRWWQTNTYIRYIGKRLGYSISNLHTAMVIRIQLLYGNVLLGYSQGLITSLYQATKSVTIMWCPGQDRPSGLLGTVPVGRRAFWADQKDKSQGKRSQLILVESKLGSSIKYVWILHFITSWRYGALLVSADTGRTLLLHARRLQRVSQPSHGGVHLPLNDISQLDRFSDPVGHFHVQSYCDTIKVFTFEYLFRGLNIVG